MAYHITLWINRGGYYQESDSVWSVTSWFTNAGLQYLLMFVVSIAIYYMIFGIMKAVRRPMRIAMHFVTIPIYIYVSWIVCYRVKDSLDIMHLQGLGQIWDIYIPTLVYLILFSVMHAFEYHQTIEDKRRLEVKLVNVALHSELKAIKSQLNPHFLYNVFNSISASVPDHLEATREMIAELSDLFRYQLKASVQEWVTLDEEILFVRKYLSLESKRYGDRLRFDISVPAHLRDCLIPPLIIQPIVENAVKHGISPLIDGGKINVKAVDLGDTIEIRVVDTGVGFTDTDVGQDGIGIKNTKYRLEKMLESTLNIEANNPTGTIVHFKMPMHLQNTDL